MRTYRIVIVENDPDEQFFMMEGFRAEQRFEVMAQLQNGDVLFEWLAAHPDERPDLVLSDLNMPGKNGYDIIAQLQSRPEPARIPVIITSTSSTPVIIDKCLSLGAAGYLVKPDTLLDYVPYVRKLYGLIEERQLC